MWSSVNEKITDGTSGLAPNSGAVALVVGTSSKGGNSSLTIGKKSDIAEIVGYGEMPNRLRDMQKTMGDVSILAYRTEGDIKGTLGEISTQGNINLTVTGEALCTCAIDISVYTAGAIEQAEVKITMTGDLEKDEVLLIPSDGLVKLEYLGLSLLFPKEQEYTENNTWSFGITAPTSSFEVIKKAIDEALEVYTPEFIMVAQNVDAEFVKSLGELSERLFEDHKPTLFITETSLDSSKTYEEAIADKQKEFSQVEARFVSVVCQPLMKGGSALGLCAGHLTKAHVNQSIGATNKFHISQYTAPVQWTNIHSRALDGSRFTTLRTYAGLQNLFWTNGRTMAGDKSDYRYIEVVRTVFKAIRLARRASLPYIQSAGDEVGLQNLLAEVRNSISGMTSTSPKELDEFEVAMPSGQDVVNNGVQFNISLFGIPIIRKINLNFMFKYNKGK